MKYAMTMAIVALLAGAPAGYAADAPADGGKTVTLIAPGGAQAAITALIPGFEQKTGYVVKASFGHGEVTHLQAVKGEPFDVYIVQPPLDDVLASGNAVAKSQVLLASVAVGVAVRSGVAKPDISTPEAVKTLLLAAHSISYPDPATGAAAGVSLTRTLKVLGLTDQIKAKTVLAQGGADAMARLAKGEVGLGLTFLSEMNDPGIDVVGPLPAAISPPTQLVGFVSAHAPNPPAAQALLDYLSSAAAAAVYRQQKMTPGPDAAH